MRWRQKGQQVLIRFEIGESFPDSLNTLTKAQGWNSGFLAGIGAVKDVQLGYYNLTENQYATFDIPETVEVVNLIGNLSQVDQNPFWHLHAIVADHQGNLKGGHLMKFTVAVTLEVTIVLSEICVHRTKDEITGLNLLNL